MEKFNGVIYLALLVIGVVISEMLSAGFVFSILIGIAVILIGIAVIETIKKLYGVLSRNPRNF